MNRKIFIHILLVTNCKVYIESEEIQMLDRKAELSRCGKELFSSKGYKDTNVADITKMAGMATGTFYNYYPSKDKLFMELFIEENVRLKKHIVEIINLDADPINVMKEMMYLNLEGMKADPILKEWYNREAFTRIEQGYREENGLEHVDFLYDSFIEVVRKWQLQEKMRQDITAEMIMAIFGALINIDTHKEEVGIKYFPQVLEYMAGFTMKGLMDCK